jgi:hypothetical protein
MQVLRSNDMFGSCSRFNGFWFWCKQEVHFPLFFCLGSSTATYLHFEFRSGSTEEFLSLFSLFCVRMKDTPGLEIDSGGAEETQQ